MPRKRKTEEEKARAALRRSLSYQGGSEGHDYEFVNWWSRHAVNFPTVSEDDARLIWTAGYDDGDEHGRDVATPSEY